ncbi:hypothetical protein RGQ21_67860 [Kitasatospora aureofaciens]|nr:hypothetical protein RGQ21_67860 [Kitasatospora aureofaciens]
MFEVGDRVKVVSDDIGMGYWKGRVGSVSELTDGALYVRVRFDDSATASFRDDELDFYQDGKAA